jgi:hypothetical protein
MCRIVFKNKNIMLLATAVEPAPKPHPVTKAHLFSLHGKLSPFEDVHNPLYFQAFLDNIIALLPFTVDPFGGLGYHAHRFLYGTTTSNPTHVPPQPPPALSHHAAALYNQLQSLPLGLLPKTTKLYTPPPNTTSSNPLSPHSWAHHCMALNISTHLAQHLLRSLTNASAFRSLHTDTPTRGILGFPFPHRITTAFLYPLPHYLMQAG